MSTFVRSAIAALVLIGAVSAASANPYQNDTDAKNFADTIWETIQERGQ